MAKRKSRSIRTVIKNYGLMWRRDSVFWGKGNQKGTLQGRRSGKIIDFESKLECMCSMTRAEGRYMSGKRAKEMRACFFGCGRTEMMGWRIVGTTSLGSACCQLTRTVISRVATRLTSV